MRTTTRYGALGLFVGMLAGCARGPVASTTKAAGAGGPGLAAIREDDLRRDLFAIADDSFRGRRAGTADELRAAVWVAERARQAGLEPAGDDGTYFQFYPLRRLTVAATSRLLLNGQPLALWRDAWVTAPINARLNGPVVWLNTLADTVRRDLRGKIVAMPIVPPTPLPAPKMSLWGMRYALAAINQQSAALRARGVAGIVLAADATTEPNLDFVGHRYEDGQYLLPTMLAPEAPVPVLLVRQAVGTTLRKTGARLQADLEKNDFEYPSVNVVARVAGTDPARRQEHVLFSGHHDHDGIGKPVAGDSIWNGADDNATVTVALLAIGRAWKEQPGARSALFVWHGAEERGLLGSRWFAEHPTVPKSSLVAVLNGDMMGRNAPDSAALLGAIPPHRNSRTLTEMALQANQNTAGFKLDTTWDAATHPEGWYFRSDHLPYARAGIPAVFFTTLLHPDYHTPRDEASRIDIGKLTRMTRWMYATGWLVSEASERLKADPDFKLER